MGIPACQASICRVPLHSYEVSAAIEREPLRTSGNGRVRQTGLTERTASRVPVREYRIAGMDCADCARHVRSAIAAVPGVEGCDVFLTSERAMVRASVLDDKFDDAVRRAVQRAGYEVVSGEEQSGLTAARRASRRVLVTLGLVSVMVLSLVVFGEWLGLLDGLTERVPWYLPAVLTLLLGRRPLLQVVRSALRGKVISHTLMTVGATAAALTGQWSTAFIVVVFMRVGAYTESMTSDKSRRALKQLGDLAPRTARVVSNGQERSVAVGEVAIGDLVLVRPGEAVPVDGVVTSGSAYVNQAAITGEAAPVEAKEGQELFAASYVSGGAVTLRATAVGEDTTFAAIVRLVLEAEANRGEVERIADRFSGYYLPLVAFIAALTWMVGGSLQATIAVLVVACSCSFALATPIAMAASVGSAAHAGVLIKGGRYIEALHRITVLLVDKTGTLTTGAPHISDIIPAASGVARERDLLQLAAAVEQNSEHPLAEAVRRAAFAHGITPQQAKQFTAEAGVGVTASVDGYPVSVGRLTDFDRQYDPVLAQEADRLMADGKSVLALRRDGAVLGVLAAADTLRPALAEALAHVREAGVPRVMLISGDNEGAVASIARTLGIEYRADLLPHEKTEVVRDLQRRGERVAMIGDGVNDAPALAQADVGIAMGVAGTDVAIEASHVALMNDDWRTVPLLFSVSRRTMRVVKMNIGFTALYNLAGLTLAALGLLPPVVAAALQSVPDLGILANSSRLLRLPSRGVSADRETGPNGCHDGNG